MLVQPCSETKTAAGRNLERLCAEKLAAFALVSNPNRGEKSADGGRWADYKAVHPWSVESISKADVVVSDTGRIIAELDADGDMDGPQNPQAVSTFLRACESAGALIAGDYVFNHAGPIDTDTITQARKAK